MGFGIGLVDFSVEHAEKQGGDIHALVNREREWLRQVFPGTLKRYQDLPAAIQNIARVATHEGINAYIPYYEGRAIGIGTIILDAVVEHPTEGIFWGNDIDYWLAPEEDEELSRFQHVQTARKLEGANYAIEHFRKDKRPPFPLPNPVPAYNLAHNYDLNPIMGTIRVSTPNPSIGLADIMEPVGEPAALTVPNGEDPFGLTKDGDLLQLYTHNISPIK